MKISTVSEMRDLDKTAMDQFGIADELLMENAGIAVYSVILEKIGIKGKRFLIFCGAGNNGGDGFVVARKIHSNGGDVKVYVLGGFKKYKGAAKLNLDIAKGLPIEIKKLETTKGLDIELSHSHAVVDAIFGTGLIRDVKGLYADVIRLINNKKKAVISVDIPSGVNGDTGMIMGVAIHANFTVSFGLPKLGNLLFPGFSLCGEQYLSHISFPPSMYDANTSIEISQPISIPERDKMGNKGDFGKALFIAGAKGYFGAPCFAALSFLKVGGGYSRLAAPKSITPFLANKASEIVYIPMLETKEGSISLENKEALSELAQKMDVVVIGPGLSIEDETLQLARRLVQEINKPIIIDGDGITALSGEFEILANRRSDTILTPHLKEMSRFTGYSVNEIAADSVNILRNTVKATKAFIVLKGAHSLIGCPDGSIYINMSGNSGMATAGSGDTLTGAIAGMFGLGLNVKDAVSMGVFIHGFAGDLAAKDLGEDGMTAQDLLTYLPLAVKAVREDICGDLKKRYAGPKII